MNALAVKGCNSPYNLAWSNLTIFRLDYTPCLYIQLYSENGAILPIKQRVSECGAKAKGSAEILGVCATCTPLTTTVVCYFLPHSHSLVSIQRCFLEATCHVMTSLLSGMRDCMLVDTGLLEITQS